jgi:predicted DsbA family dithiol-disulfide isomerase
MAKTPNTLASHVLIRLAHEEGGPELQSRLVEALFAAYFTQGRDVGDASVLDEVGLDREHALARLADPANHQAVVQDEGLARDLGLSGVPSVVIDGHLLFSGAQPSSTMVRLLRSAVAELRSTKFASGQWDVSHVGL